jgi:hypothetical protein
MKIQSASAVTFQSKNQVDASSVDEKSYFRISDSLENQIAARYPCHQLHDQYRKLLGNAVRVIAPKCVFGNQ